MRLGRANILGELVSVLAHELNQPLAAILSNAQAARRFLASGKLGTEELREILDDIVRDNKRAVRGSAREASKISVGQQCDQILIYRYRGRTRSETSNERSTEH